MVRLWSRGSIHSTPSYHPRRSIESLHAIICDLNFSLVSFSQLQVSTCFQARNSSIILDAHYKHPAFFYAVSIQPAVEINAIQLWILFTNNSKRLIVASYSRKIPKTRLWANDSGTRTTHCVQSQKKVPDLLTHFTAVPFKTTCFEVLIYDKTSYMKKVHSHNSTTGRHERLPLTFLPRSQGWFQWNMSGLLRA